jgi:hypothetical protein
MAKYRREHTDKTKRNASVRERYQAARDAGFTVVEARRRAHWANPIK